MTASEKHIMKVLKENLGESAEMKIAGVLRGGRIYKGEFYTMCGLEPRRFFVC